MRILLTLLLLSSFSFGQVSGFSFIEKEYSKEVTEYKAKIYITEEILEASAEPQKFFVDAVTAATSGELTALAYDCGEKKKGLLFGFWGSRWNDYGVTYNSYGFTHLELTQAISLLDKIEEIADNNRDYLLDSANENNILYSQGDFKFIIYYSGNMRVRVVWNSFDSDWGFSELKRTSKRLKKILGE